MDVTCYIYYLKDPRDGSIRYVGATGHIRTRLLAHLTESNNAARCRWIASLRAVSLVPELEVLEIVSRGEDWGAAERKWIKQFRADGHPLFNLSPGGEGAVGHHPYKLSLKRANEIRTKYATRKYKQIDLAEEYGVSQYVISQILRGTVWRDKTNRFRNAVKADATGLQTG